MKYINLETYPRRSHYEYFKSLAYPYVGLPSWPVCGRRPTRPMLFRSCGSGLWGMGL